MAKESIWSAREATAILRIGDVLIPAGAGLPRASGTADLLGAMGRICAIRPDLIAPMREVVGDLQENSDLTIEDLRAHGDVVFLAVTELVAGAYFLDSEVVSTLDYLDRPTIPLDDEASRVSELEALVAPVVERGNIWRATV